MSGNKRDRRLGSAQKSKALSYESMMKELAEAVAPVLYYPETDEQQQAIRERRGHCFYLDKDTKDLFYINSRGTITPISSTFLTSKDIHDIKTQENNHFLEYKKPNTKKEKVAVRKIRSLRYGPGFQVSKKIMQDLVAKKELPEDPIMTQAEETLKHIRTYDSNYKKVVSLFSGGRESLQKNRMIGVMQIKALLKGEPTCNFQQMSKKPQKEDFIGQGDNVYVILNDPAHPEQVGFWHIDRSQEDPVLTEWPLSKHRAMTLRDEIFRGTTSDVVSLPIAASKQISKDLLSDGKLYPHFMEDWSYNDSSNALNRAIENPGVPNKRLYDLCRKIHQNLTVIGQDYYHAFPESRGLIPQIERQKMIQMLTSVLEDKDSAEARHFLRTKHRVYHETYSVHKDYEASSFVWSDDKTLYYIDEHKQPQKSPMTKDILYQLRKIEADSLSDDLYISAKKVYQLMSRPNFAYFIWENVSYYTPWQADRKKTYFHTGTAQEMLYEIHDMKLSSRAALYQAGKIILLAVVPTVLAAFGLWIPLAWLALKGAYLLVFQWTMVGLNVDFTYKCLRTMGHMMLHPELQQLDSALQELDEALYDTRQGTTARADVTDVEDDAPDCPLLNPSM
ncbi:MAG: hypothetical protein CK424_08680 [Legionella sp.]|nr:MAG: hypothetical protein CK424_08680 [Legionella sp.]